jgi:hypothetical protein
MSTSHNWNSLIHEKGGLSICIAAWIDRWGILLSDKSQFLKVTCRVHKILEMTLISGC